MGGIVKFGVVMDPINGIKVEKDSTLAMLLAAQTRDWEIFYFEPHDLWCRDGRAYGAAQLLIIRADLHNWYECSGAVTIALAELDIILMRKDPPVEREYIYTTYLLELAAAHGALVVNHPAALRDVNEKLFTAWFPQCCPPTLVTNNIARTQSFLNEQGEIVVKPLDAMGGKSVFRLRSDDPNRNVILETLSANGKQFFMAQRYLPEVINGDKRIIMINGTPIPYALARIPAPGETRANLAAGGKGIGVALSERDLWICNQIGPELRRRGLLFVGLDIIGDFCTEINVTSPTGIRELDRIYNLDIAGQFLDYLAAQIAE